MKAERTRIIVELPTDVQMAIRLRAVKDGITTGDVVTNAMRKAFLGDIDEARSVLMDKENKRREKEAAEREPIDITNGVDSAEYVQRLRGDDEGETAPT